LKVIFHKKFYETYTADPAAASGRMEAIVKALENDFKFFNPSSATEKDLALVHNPAQIERIRRSHPGVYEMGALAAGGAIMAAESALSGEPAFGLVRPPGHHASPDSCWGFCYFNNIAIAIQRLRHEGKIKKAFIFDFDLHFGDGTENYFLGIPEVDYYHAESLEGEEFFEALQKRFYEAKGFDLLAVSAGFDRHVEDWGGLLTTEDYQKIGTLIKTYAHRFCRGRRFAVLEGGYNHAVLGENVRAFLEGMKN
jgi:acetoin utilization deacetylase AcuC-like enzyme